MSQEQKTAGISPGGDPHFKARDRKPLQKNRLKGFCTVVTASRLVIHDCMLHEHDDSRWIGLPGKPYQAEAGKAAYSNIVDFESKGSKTRFKSSLSLLLTGCWEEAANDAGNH
jgi:hypothetical protein